jgi:hypothetical protein
MGPAIFLQHATRASLDLRQSLNWLFRYVQEVPMAALKMLAIFIRKVVEKPAPHKLLT